MDAGLPSWAGLIENIRRKNLPSDKANALALLEGGNPQRQALAALAIARRSSLRNDYEVIRDALFPGGNVPSPRTIALAIAQLCTDIKAPVRILTFNYDPVLEKALEAVGGSPARSFSIMGNIATNTGSIDEWRSLSDQQRRAAVLHVHGKVPVLPGEQPLEPLVLTEADYLTDGRLVSQELVRELAGHTVLFIGLSLTDPNLLAALHQLHTDPHSTTDAYAIIVPPLAHPDLDRTECAEVAVDLAMVLEGQLSFRPVLLKTFAQVAQAVADLSLAAVAPAEYRTKGKPAAKDLRYGLRFGDTLNAIYRSLGSDRRGNFPKQATLRLSENMHSAMKARRGPLEVFKRMQRQHKGASAPDERIGLFLWLRDLANVTDDEFGLRLVGTSVYVHWETWSAERVIPIEAASSYAAVQAVYSAQIIAVNILGSDRAGVWNGSFAAPLWARSLRAPSLEALARDQLLVGAVSVNSTCFMRQSDAGADTSRMSVLSVADEEEIGDFVSALTHGVARCFV